MGGLVALGDDYPENQVDEYLWAGEQHRSNEDGTHGGSAHPEAISQTCGHPCDHPSLPGPHETIRVVTHRTHSARRSCGTSFGNSDHCDDAVEGWEPEPVVVAQWPLIAGTLDFDLPEEVVCGSTSPIRAKLSGAAFQIGSELLSLDELTIVNDSFGCFAGWSTPNRCPRPRRASPGGSSASLA